MSIIDIFYLKVELQVLLVLHDMECHRSMDMYLMPPTWVSVHHSCSIHIVVPTFLHINNLFSCLQKKIIYHLSLQNRNFLPVSLRVQWSLNSRIFWYGPFSIMENAGSYNHYHHLPVSTLLIPMTEKLRGSSFSRSHRKYR